MVEADGRTMEALILHFFEGSAKSSQRLLDVVENDHTIGTKAKSALRSLFQIYPQEGRASIPPYFLGVLMALDYYEITIKFRNRNIKIRILNKIVGKLIGRKLDHVPKSLLPIVRLITMRRLCQYRGQLFQIMEVGFDRAIWRFIKPGYLLVMAGAMKEIRLNHKRYYPAIRSFVIIDMDKIFFPAWKNRDRSISRKTKGFLECLGLEGPEVDRFSLLLLRMDIARVSLANDAAFAAKEVCEIVRAIRSKEVDSEWLSFHLIDQMSILIDNGSRVGMHMLKRLAAELQGLVEEMRLLDEWGYVCNVLNSNFHIGRALMAAKHYREAEIFIGKALDAFAMAGDHNKYVQRYFRYQRHTLEALLEQSRMDTESANASVRMARWSAEILRSDWRYYGRTDEESRMPRDRKGFRSRWIDFQFRLRVFIACLSVEYRLFLILGNKLKWPTPGGGVRLSKLIEYLDVQIDRAENGHRLRQEPDSPVHRYNLAEQALDTESIAYLLGFHAKYSDELLGRDKIIEFYNEYGGKSGAHKLHPGYGVTFAQQALRMCMNPEEFPNEIRQQDFIIFAINKLKQELDKYMFSVSTVIFMFMREMGRVIAISENWRLAEAAELLQISQIILDKLENERLSILHQDDRSGVDKMLETIYMELSHAALLAGRASPGGAGMLFLEHAVFWRDRARYRWLTVGYNHEMIKRVDCLDIPKSLRAEFFSAEERLRQFVASRPSKFVFGTAAGDKRGHTAIPMKRGMSSTTSRSRASDIETSKSYEAAQRDYLAALYEIKKLIPEFDWQFQAKLLAPINILGGRLRGEVVIHFVGSDDLAFVVIHYRRKFAVFSMRNESIPTLIRSRGTIPLSGTDLKNDLGVVHSIRSMIRRFEREAAVRRSSQMRWLRLFVDPVFTGLPIHRLLTDSRLSPVVHGCSVSSAAMNERSQICEDRVTVIAPYKELKFSAVEARLCWGVSEKLTGDQTIGEVIVALNCSTIIHYCGHLFLGESGGLRCPVSRGVLNMDLTWLIENLSFNARPLVILNACRSGVSSSSTPSEVFERDRDYRRETEIKRAHVSYASCFLSLGASAVVATAWDIDDCVAFVFAWRFARNITRYPKRPIEELFFKTVGWCKSLTDSESISAILRPLLDSLSEKERCLYAAEIPQKIAEEQRRIADEYGVDCWDAFMLYR